MLNVGDWVKCKTFPKVVNGFERTSDPNIIVGEYYEILEIGWNAQNHNPNSVDGLYMLHIQGEQGGCDYWSDYFYSLRELRLEKINKIKKRICLQKVKE